MVAFQLSEEIKIGLAYDSETTKLQQYNYGSYEFFLSYELRSNQKNRQPKRFF